jgi:3-dehydroquinate synthase
LNFGHTFGHAIENLQNISHGEAVSIGMVIASKISEKYAGFSAASTFQIIELLKRYELPIIIETDGETLFDQLIADKKRTGDEIQFVLLKEIGNAMIKNISIPALKMAYKEMAT